MKSKLYPLLKFAIGWPFSFVSLIFIIKLIAPQAPLLLPQIQAVNTVLLLLSVCSFIFFYFLRAYIWFLLIKPGSRTLSFCDSCFLWASSELKRYIPGNIWSFLGRSISFSEHGVAKKDIARGLLIEAELYVLGCLLVSLLSIPFLAMYLFPYRSFLLQYTAGFFVLAAASAYIFNRQLIAYLPEKMKKVLQFALPAYSNSKTALLLFLSCISLLFFGLGYFFTIASILMLPAQLVVGLIGFFVLSFVIGYLTILTPAGFGAREGILLLGLSRITQVSLAALAALFSRIILIFAELVFIFLAYLLYKSRANCNN